MTRETLLLAAVQSGALFLAIWAIFRLTPSIPANAKAWIWRLAFLKPLLSLVPFAVVTLHVLPAPRVAPPSLRPASAVVVQTESASIDASAGEPRDILMASWFVGVASVIAFGLYGRIRAGRIARHAEPVMSSKVQGVVLHLARRAGVTAPIRVLASEEVPTPMLLSGRPSTIVLPASALAPELAGDLRLMLAHEIAHIARRDLAWFSVTWLTQALFFFDPMVWLAGRCARLDHESATDRYASQIADVPIQTYAEMLLRATVMARSPLGSRPLGPGAVAMAESYRTIHRRLEAMKHFNSQPSLLRKASVGAVALLTVGLIPVYQLAAAAAVPVAQSTEKPKVIAPAPAPVRRGKPAAKPRAAQSPVKKAPAPAPAIIRPATPAPTPKQKPSKPAAVKSPVSSISSPQGTVTVSGNPTFRMPGERPKPVAPKIVDGEARQMPDGTWAWVEKDKSPMIEHFEANQMDVAQAIAELFEKTGKKYVIRSGVEGEVTLSLQNVHIGTALENLVRQVNAGYRMSGDTYVIYPKSTDKP